MLRFFKRSNDDESDVITNPNKRKKTEEERQDKSKEYEKKTRKAISAVWTTVYDKTLKFMYCRPCKDAYGSMSMSKLKHSAPIFTKYAKSKFVCGTHNF